MAWAHILDIPFLKLNHMMWSPTYLSIYDGARVAEGTVVVGDGNVEGQLGSGGGGHVPRPDFSTTKQRAREETSR